MNHNAPALLILILYQQRRRARRIRVIIIARRHGHALIRLVDIKVHRGRRRRDRKRLAGVERAATRLRIVRQVGEPRIACEFSAVGGELRRGDKGGHEARGAEDVAGAVDGLGPHVGHKGAEGDARLEAVLRRVGEHVEGLGGLVAAAGVEAPGGDLGRAVP